MFWLGESGQPFPSEIFVIRVAILSYEYFTTR